MHTHYIDKFSKYPIVTGKYLGGFLDVLFYFLKHSL